ncbi:nucleoprotein TPR-like isoform X3 [Patiria miniata]|uniref:Rho guanine nucleotide exchange factor 11 n=1 Tax=Patiria miniata TaxID=46514 RepID=A0A914AHC9_PATMI|nr:nucleoprotein TPR-like isoform X3 [Patiria miniata]
METFQDQYGPQLIQRCVIVQKDERGYGLTVSGDNPVFIQSVKDDGAAFRAGVQKGDRIIKVNGTLVTSCNHLEVVKLIRSASYAALTLLGLPPGMKNQSPLSPPHQGNATAKPNQRREVTRPVAVTPEKDAELKNERMQTLKEMLEQEKELYQRMKSVYDVNPTEKLFRELSGITTRIKVMESQLTRAASMQAKVQTTDPREVQSSADQEVENKNRNAQQNNHKEKRKSETRSWLPHGIIHARQRSSPETLGVMSEIQPGTNLKRNNSDAQSKETAARKKHVRGMGAAESEIRRKRSDNIEQLGRSQSLPAEPGGADSDMADSSPNSTPPAKRRTDTDSSLENQEGGSVTKPHRDGTVVPPSQPFKIATVGTVEPLTSEVLTNMQAPQVQIMSMEDDDFQSDNETHKRDSACSVSQPKFETLQESMSDHPHGNIQSFEDHGPFIKLEQLEKKPAHMSIFLHYLISNSDPSSLFFYLVTDNYRTGSLKEMKKWVYEIFSTFLAPLAPLRIQVNDGIVQSIETTMSTQLQNEEAMKSIFLAARQSATAEIRELLADFRAKRALGLGSIFGDQQLHNEDMDRTQELKIVEQTLMPHLDRLTTLEAEREDKNVAMAFAITTFMKQVGVRVTSNSPLERCPSFTARDKRTKWGGKNKKQHIKGHQFVEMHYQSTVFCNHCNGLLWGIGFQGYQCQNCEFNVHKTGLCLDQLEDPCQGKEGKKSKNWRRMIPGGQRRTSDRMSQYLPPVFFAGDRKDDSEKTATSPSAAISPLPIPPIRPGLGEDEEITQLKKEVNVDSLVKQFEVKTDDPLVGSHSSQTDSGISESYDRLQDVTEGETTATKRSFLNRSASLKTKGEEKRERRPPGDRRSRSVLVSSSNDRTSSQSTDDVDMDGHSVVTALTNTAHDSSSSSLSTRSQDSQSASNDSLSCRPNEEDQAEDSDMEAEAEPSNWQDFVDKDIVKRLKPKEVKRQEVINELFHTERSHVRNLKVLDRVFYRPMLREQVLSKELIHAIFPNLNEMLELHGPLNEYMKKERKTSHVIQQVGHVLLKTFDGEAGETAKRICATFCQNQKAALEMLKHRQKKDSRLAQFLTDAEANSLCRRLPLQAIISTGMQRLTKYPLLIENLLKYTPAKSKEYEVLGKCSQCTKKLLAHVNQAVKECENHQRLVDINRHLDKGPFERSNHPIAAEYKSLDLTSRKLLHDGALTWKLSKTKTLDIYALLFSDILVVLQKQDDRYVMKCHSTTVPTQLEEKKNTHSPIIKINSVLCREVATNKRAFFLVSTSNAGPQIYELTTISTSERQAWMDMILRTQEMIRKNGKTGEPGAASSTVSNSYFKIIEEDSEDIAGKPDSGEGAAKHMEAGPSSIEINHPPQVSQPEVVIQGSMVTDEPRQESPLEASSTMAKLLQEDMSSDARATDKAYMISALSTHLSVLQKANYEKRDSKREELIDKATTQIQTLSKSLQGDFTRIESELQQKTQELTRAQQALLEQSQNQLEEQRQLEQRQQEQRQSGPESFYIRSPNALRTETSDEIAARKKANRISSSADSGGSTTDSEESGAVESSEPEEAYTPKERPSSLVMESEEGDQLMNVGAQYQRAEPQEAVAIVNEGLVNLQRAQVRKVTDVDSAEVDHIMERLHIKRASVNGIKDRTGPGENLRSVTDSEDMEEMTESAQELSIGNVALAEENWGTPPKELEALENQAVEVGMATRLDDLLNEDSDSDQETVVASGSFKTEQLEHDADLINTSPEITQSQDAFSSSESDPNAISTPSAEKSRNENGGTDSTSNQIPSTNQDCVIDSSQSETNFANLSQTSKAQSPKLPNEADTTTLPSLGEPSGVNSQPTSLIATTDSETEKTRQEEGHVSLQGDDAKNSGAEVGEQDVATAETNQVVDVSEAGGENEKHSDEDVEEISQEGGEKDEHVSGDGESGESDNDDEDDGNDSDEEDNGEDDDRGNEGESRGVGEIPEVDGGDYDDDDDDSGDYETIK